MKPPKSSKRKPVLSFAPDIDTLRMFVSALNTDFFTFPRPEASGWRRVQGDYRPVKRELRCLIQAWFDSGPNVAKLMLEHPVLARLPKIVRASVLPTQGSRAHLTYMDGPDSGLRPGDPLDIALGLFFLFLLNPDNEKLGGPCKHCSKYYVKKTKRQIIYCSKRCGLKHTSKTVIQKQRQQQRQQKLEDAKHYSELWTRTRTHKGWKQFVYDNAQVSKNWLTRSVKNGNLIEPVK